ncbi:MAG: site-2 protease family protein [Oscillospiraceae bacterium]|nr:site-2 protease family protein [Oscillospiraceae bacterium]
MKTVVIAILVFGVIIMIHELGHFVAAKLFGVKVNEFSLGMGPALFKFNRGETDYSLRLLPIGGYVSMEGENENSGDGRAFCNKPAWQRFIVLVAGAFMNLVLGFLLVIMLVGRMELIGTTTVAGFYPDAVSSQWLQQYDTVVEINGYKVSGYSDTVFQMVRDRDCVIDFTVIRNGERVALNGVAFETKSSSDGVSDTIVMDFQFYGQEKTFFNSLKYSFDWTVSIAKQVWYSLGDLLTGSYGMNQLSGPVGTLAAIGEAASKGFDSLFLLVAFITINVGVFNLLPVPALDGGRLLFVLIEMIIRRPIPQKYESIIHATGLVLLLGLVVAVTFNDIFKLITG